MGHICLKNRSCYENIFRIFISGMFISAMDSVKSVCNFEYLLQDAAMEKLYEGEIQAVIVLPDGRRCVRNCMKKTAQQLLPAVL